MLPLIRGLYTARLAMSPQDVAAAQSLRNLRFRAARGLFQRDNDADRFDPVCNHILVSETKSGMVVCCYRVLTFADGQDLHDSYSAQYYELSALRGYLRPMLELGRFCIHPNHRDPDILRVAWAALTQLVGAKDVGMLFGCSSFDGADPGPHLSALAYLGQRHLAPSHLQPGVIVPDSLDLRGLAPMAPLKAPALPSLLRTYLSMGGWVSDHAVIDAELNTLHVFTGLDLDKVPAARARALRSIASDPHDATS